MTKTIIQSTPIPLVVKETGTATYTVGTDVEYKTIDLGGQGVIFNRYISVSEGGTVALTNEGEKTFSFSIVASAPATELTVTYTAYYIDAPMK